MRPGLRSRMSVVIGGLLILASLMAATVAHATTTRTASLVKVERIGHPAWTPVDLHVFTAPIGTASDGYAEFAKTQEIILPPPHYLQYPCLGIGPGTPEPPPYDADVAAGVENAGYPEGHVFAPQQFSNGRGVYFAYMVVPSPTSPNLGSSPDFARGPIIPNSLFPIQVNGVSYRNFKSYDPSLANFEVPALSDPCIKDPPFHVDGFSHFPIFLADNSDFGPTGLKLRGIYTYKVKMQDSAGAGWSISATFRVAGDGSAPGA
jgi:hypothetical protein